MSMMSRGSVRSRGVGNAFASSKGKNKHGNIYYIGITGETPKLRKKPLVFIDVNLGKEKGKQKLTVFKEDDPK